MAESVSCLHCQSPVPAGSRLPDFCCAGCEAVHALLGQEGLGRFYELSDGQRAPVAETPRQRSYSWLEPLLERSEQSGGEVCSLELDVQGVHCAACVWLMNELFRREEGGAAITVNPSLGKVGLSWRRGRFDPRAFLSEVERFGYLFGPSRKRTDDASRALLLRMGVTAALGMNVMMFSLAFYVGLAPDEEAIFRLFTRLSVALSAGVVAVGGWPFFRSAWQALRRGVLHLDLPIAAGMLLAFGASLWQARSGRGDLYYFDTLNVFVLLMLVGRWLQQRVLDRNRRHLLEDDGADGLWVRRREGARLVSVRAPQVRGGDHLVVAPGDLVPVDAQALETGSFTTDWITGEPAVRAIGAGSEVPAGAFNAGREAVAVLARTDFADSPLPSLLRTPEVVEPDKAPAHARFFDRYARIYVAAVLALAAAGLVLWWPAGPERALEVTVALLVVTCPCALGIAIPLAYELAQARLRRLGLFVRRRELLDKLPRVRKVLFDKTGTLTLGRLHLVDPDALDRLSPELRDAAFDMVSRSNHPVSRCLADALGRAGAKFDPDAKVREEPGMGLELGRGGRVLRLGRPGWAGEPCPPLTPAFGRPSPSLDFARDERQGGALGLRRRMGLEGDFARAAEENAEAAAECEPSPEGEGGRPKGDRVRGGHGPHVSDAESKGTALSVDGETVALFRTAETVRAGAREELAAMRAAGLEVWLVSGDEPGRVADFASGLGLDADHARGGLRPEQKAALVDELDDGDTLFVGDGVNDSLAFERALCAGTPAIDRPVLPGKADFFLLGDGIAALREAFSLSGRLRRVVRQLVAIAVAYNVLAVAASLAGWMTPLRAAIAMPASSVLVLLFAVTSLEGRTVRRPK